MTPVTNKPRSILKRPIHPLTIRSSSSSSLEHHAVHFPPSPCITITFEALPPSIYDRSPIAVGPNNCALPERGCPGRTYYTLDDNDSTEELGLCTRFLKNFELQSTKGQEVHPRAVFARQAQAYGLKEDAPFSTPPLTPDFSSTSSSESEESDVYLDPLPCAYPFPVTYHSPKFNSVTFSAAKQDKTSTIFAPSLLLSTPLSDAKSSVASVVTKLDDDLLDDDAGYVEDNESFLPSMSYSSASAPQPKKKCKTMSSLRSAIRKRFSSLSFQSDEAGDAACLDGF